MLAARSPIDDQEMQDALRVARAAREQAEPYFSHPDGRKLRYDNPHDLAEMRSLAVGRQHFAAGGAIEREVQAIPRFSIRHEPIGLAAGVPTAAPMPEPAPAAVPAHQGGGLDDLIAGALNHARMHLAHGGGAFGSNPLLHAMPGTDPLAAAPSARGMLPGGVQPVLSQNLQHGMLHHLLRQRPRFEDGGDANSGDNDSSGAGGVGGFGGNYSGGADNYGAGYGGFTSAERAQNASDDAASDADPNSWGGGGGSVSRGSQIGGGYSSFSAPSSSIGYGGGDTSGTTMGNAVNAVAGLGSGSAGVGNIGLSGSSMGDGWGGNTVATSANSGLGFGSFNGNTLGDGAGAAFGVNGVGNGWHGLSDGSTAGNVGASYGFQNPDSETTPGSVGNQIGGWDAGAKWSPNTSSFGDLSGVGFGGFTGSDIASAVKAAQGAGAFGNLSNVSFGPSATDGTAGAVQSGLFGRTGNFGLSGPNVAGSSDVGSVPSGSVLSTANQPGFDNFGLSTNAMTNSLGVLGDGALPSGFASPEIGMQQSPMIGGYTPDNWTPVRAATDMFTNPSDYFNNSALANFHAAPNFARGALSDANIATGMTSPVTAGNFITNMVGGPTMHADVDPTGATAMFGLTGPQKTGLLSSLGVSPNADSVDTMNALNGTMADQVGYTLGQIASDPQYAAVRKAATDPSLSATQQANTFATGYQGVDPNDQVAAAQRAAEAQALSSWSADPAVASPALPGTTPAASSAPTPANTSWSAATDPSAATALGAAGYATAPDGYSLSPTDTGIYGPRSPAGLHTGAESEALRSDAAQQAFSGMPSMVAADAADHVTKSGASGYSYNDGSQESDAPVAPSTTEDAPTPYTNLS